MTNAATEIQRFRVNRNVWKSNLTKEIVDLEDNLDQLFHIAGVKPHRIVTIENSEIDESTIVIDSKRMRQNQPVTKGTSTSSYEIIVDEYFEAIEKAIINVCGLITSVTEFDLPIPVLVLLRIASRLHLLKCADYRKKMSGSISRKYVYTHSTRLIEASLELFKWISCVVGTNSLPFQPFINHNILNLLEWTKSSGLMQHDEAKYYELRTQIFCNISIMLETLSTNLNLEPKQLKTLIERDMIDSLEETLFSHSRAPTSISKPLVNGTPSPSKPVLDATSMQFSETNPSVAFRPLLELKENYSTEVLQCLERLFVVYGTLLEAPLEQKLKTFVIRLCLEIYRDFEKNVISLAVRRQLIRMVECIANRPYATSTTELSWHVFELAERMESDAEIKFIARRSIKVGMAHRPTIVSNYGVNSTYGCKLMPLSSSANAVNGLALPASGTAADIEDSVAQRASPSPPPPPTIQSAAGQDEGLQQQSLKDEQQHQAELNSDISKSHVVQSSPSETTATTEGERELGGSKQKAADKNVTEVRQDEEEEAKKKVVSNRQEKEEKTGRTNREIEEREERPEDDPQVQSYLSLFVDKPAS